MAAIDRDTNLEWEKRWVGRPADTHFSADGSSPLARDNETNRLETHATLGERVEEDGKDSDLLVAAAAAAVGVLATLGTLKVAPHVRAWWRERRSKGTPAQQKPELVEPEVHDATIAAANFASEVNVLLEEQRMRMSTAEAQQRLVKIVLAAAVIADNIRALSAAQIDDNVSAELRDAIEKLSVPEITASLNSILASRSPAVDERASNELVRIFGGGQVITGAFEPLRNERVAAILHIPRAA